MSGIPVIGRVNNINSFCIPIHIMGTCILTFSSLSKVILFTILHYSRLKSKSHLEFSCQI